MMLRNQVRTVREARGLTQAALAELAGISRKSLSYVETGRTPDPAVTTSLALARALRCAVGELFQLADSSGAG